MVEMPSSQPGGILKDYIQRADDILREKKFQDVATSRLAKSEFNLGREVGLLLDELFQIASRIKEGSADSPDVYEMCSLLNALTGDGIRDGELFSIYILRLRNIPLIKEARAQVAATVSSATSPAPARPMPPTLRGSSRIPSPIPATASRAVPPPIPSNRTSAPGQSPIAGRPTLPGRVEVMLRGGGKTFVTRRGAGGTATPPAPAASVTTGSVQTVSPVPATAPRPVMPTKPSDIRPSAPVQPSVSQRPKTGMPVQRSLPRLQPDDNASGGIITREKSRDGNTKIRHINDIKRAKKPGDK